MLHQKNKESLQDKQLKDKNRAVAKRENEREMLRKKQQNMQMNSHEPEGEMVEATYPSDFKNPDGSTRAVARKKTGRPNAQGPESGRKEIDEAGSPADANKEKMLQKKQLMLNRQKLQLQTKAVNSGQKTDMSMRKESLTLSNFLEGKTKKKKNPDVEIMPEVDAAKGVKESADCPVCGCDPCQCLEGTIAERADTWHPDPEKDRKLGGPGANQRAREDRAAASKPKSDPKKLKKGESYYDYAKRQKSYKSSGKTAAERLAKLRKEDTELDERTRYAKETGKDFKTGNPSEKGGKEPAPAMKSVKNYMRKTGGAMSARGKAIAIRGKKKEKGAKPKFKSGPTPVDKIKGQLAKKRAPKPSIGSRFD